MTAVTSFPGRSSTAPLIALTKKVLSARYCLGHMPMEVQLLGAWKCRKQKRQSDLKAFKYDCHVVARRFTICRSGDSCCMKKLALAEVLPAGSVAVAVDGSRTMWISEEQTGKVWLC